ncbi:MAG: methylenetetrahydrofolate reductase [Acidiferrobacterales bacterium]|nr:methylenetetrahydrofolate reductase [Acidiferrobacterales bacterium]
MSKLQQRIDNNEFIITCELTPPKGTDLTALFAKADMLKHHITAFNLTESHAARMAMDPAAVAHLLLDRGIEPIVQMTSRDKNRIAIQACMLGAAALGIPNLVFMGGDPPKAGDHPDAKPVFDLFASQLLDAVKAIQSGTDYMGNALSGTPKFCVGAVVNPGSPNLDTEIENMYRKIESGACFLQTQAVYDTEQFHSFMEKIGDVGVPILAGVIPIKSVKMARYMNEKVPGITVPDALISQVAEQGDDRERIAATSVEISGRIVSELRSIAGGLHLMAIGWEDRIPQILESGGVSRQPG